jgi:acetyl-CoA carboxylase carboxyltransferase component
MVYKFVAARPVAVINYDFTVLGGSQGLINHAKTDHIHKIAAEQSIPIVFQLDGGGARGPGPRQFWLLFSGNLVRSGQVVRVGAHGRRDTSGVSQKFCKLFW